MTDPTPRATPASPHVPSGAEPGHQPDHEPGVEPGAGATPTNPRPVEYKGAPLDRERGPGLGCFRFQIVVLAILVILTPLSVAWTWPAEVSAVLLFAVILLLLLTGQTIIFLLRLVAADRRAEGRRRPLAAQTMTVGEIEDEAREREDAALDQPPPD